MELVRRQVWPGCDVSITRREDGLSRFQGALVLQDT